MIKKTVKYTDYNGEVREETHFFHLTKSEITEMELSIQGGFAERIKAIVDAKDTPEIINVFKDLVLKSYGVKSADGRRFIKTDENGNKLAMAFAETEAYSEIFMELATNDTAAAEFVNGIIPANIDKEGLKKVANEAQK